MPARPEPPRGEAVFRVDGKVAIVTCSFASEMTEDMLADERSRAWVDERKR